MLAIDVDSDDASRGHAQGAAWAWSPIRGRWTGFSQAREKYLHRLAAMRRVAGRDQAVIAVENGPVPGSARVHREDPGCGAARRR